MPFAGGGGLDGMVATMRADATARAEEAAKAFQEILEREGIEGEWRTEEGATAAILSTHARCADLTILGQPNDEEAFRGSSADAVLVSVLMTSGRPVLAVPYAGQFDTVGDRVLIAWNASREASRAVNDALPLLRTATHVTVLAIDPKSGAPDAGADARGEAQGAAICRHLARHGVKAEAAHTIASGISEGEALLSYASDLGVDLIVAGGYGHSRAREMVFGGVTRTLIQEMTVPMFLSH
jgi:nucleotide-binding universal stress UspA family protein